MTSSATLLERYKGCLLGLAVADALGAPFEGLENDLIRAIAGDSDQIVAKPTVETMYYTDDTQMTIGVAETLITHGRIEPDALAKSFADNFDSNRGYGPGAKKIIQAMIDREDWQKLSEDIYPGGSYGNGAAMRIAPVGLAFHRDLETLNEQVRLASEPTHKHNLAVEGALLIAHAISFVMRHSTFDRKDFYDYLKKQVNEEEFQWQLSIADMIEIGSPLWSSLGNSLEAHRSVLASIACFAVTPDSYEQTIGRAIFLGNDTDTLAAMAGAISGAHLGIQAVPTHLLDIMEEQGKGRHYIEDLAVQLYERFEGERVV